LGLLRAAVVVLVAAVALKELELERLLERGL
jgi:hypothetical protein